MFNYISKFGEQTRRRFEAIVLDLESASSSMNDAVNNFIEEFVKSLNQEESVKADIKKNDGKSKTIFELLKDEKIKTFFCSVCNMQPNNFKDVCNLISSGNDHKHTKLRSISFDEANMLMRHIFNFTYPYFQYKHKSKNESFYSSDFVCEHYGAKAKKLEQQKKEIEQQKRKIEKLEKETGETKKIIQDKAFENLSLEKQSAEYQLEIERLTEIKITTLEEKVANISDVLKLQSAIMERQVSLLEKMEALLSDGKTAKWGSDRLPSA